MNFNVKFLNEAEEFIEKLDHKTRRKVLYNIRKAQEIRSPELLKKLSGNIWEFRTNYNKKTIRIFAFWDKRNEKRTLIFCTHGIVKKTNKIPSKEIIKAEKIRNQYLNQ